MKKEKYYYIPYNEQIFALLMNFKIKHRVYTDAAGRLTQLQFTLYDDGAYWPIFAPILPKSNVDKMIFSDEEMLAAPWLTVRTDCMRAESRNEEKTFRYECFETRYNTNGTPYEIAHHFEQVAPYELKPIKWDAKHHVDAGCVEQFFTVFCDGQVKTALESGGVKGVEFSPVIWSRKKGMHLPDTYQITPLGQIPREAITIDAEQTVRRECPICHKERYDFTNTMRLIVEDKYLDPKCDFYNTVRIFGFRPPHAIMVVSQKVYRILTEAELTRNLVFEPVVLT